MKVDKSGSTIRTENTNLEQKSLKFIYNNNCIKYNEDPAKKYENQINNLINNNTPTLNNKKYFIIIVFYDINTLIL